MAILIGGCAAFIGGAVKNAADEAEKVAEGGVSNGISSTRRPTRPPPPAPRLSPPAADMAGGVLHTHPPARTWRVAAQRSDGLRHRNLLARVNTEVLDSPSCRAYPLSLPVRSRRAADTVAQAAALASPTRRDLAVLHTWMFDRLFG
jgi:hypothetical protein